MERNRRIGISASVCYSLTVKGITCLGSCAWTVRSRDQLRVLRQAGHAVKPEQLTVDSGRIVSDRSNSSNSFSGVGWEASAGLETEQFTRPRAEKPVGLSLQRSLPSVTGE